MRLSTFYLAAQTFVMVPTKQKRWPLGFKLLQTIFGGVSQTIQHLFINTNCILRAYKSYNVVQCAQETLLDLYALLNIVFSDICVKRRLGIAR